MQLIDSPDKVQLPFADVGLKNTIPVTTGTPGAASLEQGFPAVTMQPLPLGGIPPSGLDMNGILNLVSALSRWASAGAGFEYDSVFAADPNVNGYPAGARVARSDGEGYWLNIVDDNTTDPEAGGAGWIQDTAGNITSITMTNANVTLTALEYGRQIIKISGALSANLNLIFPNIQGARWLIINNCTGNFIITAKTSGGSGPNLDIGSSQWVHCDTNNIVRDQVFKNSLSTNGYLVLPVGVGKLILQWGALITNNVTGQGTLTFPLKFPNGCLHVFGFPTWVSVAFPIMVGNNGAWTTTSGGTFYAINLAGTPTVAGISWFAIGW